MIVEHKNSHFSSNRSLCGRITSVLLFCLKRVSMFVKVVLSNFRKYER